MEILTRRIYLVKIFLLLLVIVGLSLGIFFGITLSKTKSNESKSGAVATSSAECTKAAVDILEKGGTAVDSAVTAILCQGVTFPQSSGLGGGLVATVYIKKTGEIITLNAREVAPLAANRTMFPDNLSSLEGGLAIAVPGELKGLYLLHKRYGKLSWQEVVEPAIRVAENGYKVSKYLAQIFTERGERIKSKQFFNNDIFIDPKTKAYYKEGDVIINAKLARTLKIIAAEGSDAIYGNGSLAQDIVNEIQQAGGVIKAEDFRAFKPRWGKPIVSELFNGNSFFAFPLPTSGHILNFIINILNGYDIQNDSIEFHNRDKLLYHRIVEAFKFGFAMRTKLGDEMSAEVVQTLSNLESAKYAESIRNKINDEKTFGDFEHYGATANASVLVDHGTGHISILAPNGDAVAITSTINYIFGSYVMSESTGIIFNNEMNDFSIPVAVSDGLLPAPANFIEPGKNPMSSMSPVIILDEQKDAVFVAGGAGGILIMTSLIQVIINSLYLNQPIDASIARKLLHHQLQPMVVQYEQGYDPEILKFLETKGHEIDQQSIDVGGFASVVAILRRNGRLEAAVDPRRGGLAVVF